MGIKQRLGDFYWNFRSTKFDRKLLIIESDDWGSLRTESKEVRKALHLINPKFTSDPYLKYDGLASSEDLNALLELLKGVRDFEGNSVQLTANFCTANPDFDRIKASGFDKFYYERFDSSILKKVDGNEVLNLWSDGINNRLIQPQLHGREHIHSLAWLMELKKGNTELLRAFDLGVWGVPYRAHGKQHRKNLQAALDMYNLPGEHDFHKEWIKDGAELFKEYFGFKSKTFIAPAYTWPESVHEYLAEVGVESMQGIKLQYDPSGSGYRKRLRLLGSKCKLSGLLFYPRNVFFEPSLYPHKDWYSETLTGIKKAFDNKLPAIIGSHRINYIGKLDEKNRTENLKTLKQILTKVVELYPDVQFISSDQLGEKRT